MGNSKTLKKNYNAIKNLLEVSGFGWDPVREVVKAEDSVWADYLKAHPEAKTWRTKSVSCYDDLRTIFGDGGATGKYSNGSLDSDINKDEVEKNVEYSEGVQSPETEDRTDYQQETTHLGDDVDTPNQQKRQLPTVGSSSRLPKKPRKSTGESMVDAIQGMAATVTFLANKRFENKGYSAEQLHVALKAIPDLDSYLILDALELLKDEKKAKVFMELADVDAKKQWLMRKLQKY
ncbi:Myb/SANT-like domain [Macleaya cordata]|uniref:Myb/SANT-like domain n=1 Tax=Macleaya cordata TaxID=56857 RepID=A0A200QQ36_MACCD|nr:Myb/SANT-like domain [Macleaya cordata]